jgi:hydrogenase maturation protein HypF
VDYDAQAAIELEGIAVDSSSELDIPAEYHVEFHSADWNKRESSRIGVAPLWRAIVGDIVEGVSHPEIAARFHAAVAKAFIQAACSALAATGVRQVVLSGGCMHNRRLASLLRSGLEAQGLQVFQHRSVSPGDGGLSYGQAVVAAAILYSENTL